MGGAPVDVPYVPYDINEAFNKWYDYVHENEGWEVPQKMKYQRWYDVKEVQAIVDTFKNENIVNGR